MTSFVAKGFTLALDFRAIKAFLEQFSQTTFLKTGQTFKMKKEKSKNKPPEKTPRKQHLQPEQPVIKNSYADLAGLALILALGIIIYSNSFNCSFHFDDIRSIVDNIYIRNLYDIKTIWDYSQTRFVPNLSFALNYHFGALQVWGYHLVNLLIHLTNACLVYWLTILVFSSPALKDKATGADKKWIAFFTALLFVAHPLATQSVTYIVQRMASMLALFYLLSLVLYVKARLTDTGNFSKYLFFAGSFIAASLAMLTKENAFTLPFALVLFEAFFLQAKKLSINFRDYRTILFIAAFLGIIITIPLNFSFSVFNPIPPTLNHAHTYTVTPLNYLFTQFSVIVKYIQLLFLPLNQNLDYDFPISNNFFEPRAIGSLLLLLSLIALAVFLFKKHRVISFGIFWFFLTLSIESSFIPIEDYIFEHRTYLPSYGFFLILSAGIYGLFRNKNKYPAIALLFLIAGAYSALTYQRNKVWKDKLSLWNDVVSKSPNKARAYNNRGNEYSKLEQWDKAIADYNKAIEINPTYFNAYSNRGTAYGKIGQWQKLIDDCSMTIRLKPKYFESYYNRGHAYGNIKQWDKAIADYSSAISLDSAYADAYYNRGIIYANLGQWDKAIADYTIAVNINPKKVAAYNNRGVAYVNLGQWDKAIADYSRAIETDSSNIPAYNNWANLYIKIKKYKEAISIMDTAIRINPNAAQAYRIRGIAEFNSGNRARSCQDFQKAAQLGLKPAAELYSQYCR